MKAYMACNSSCRPDVPGGPIEYSGTTCLRRRWWHLAAFAAAIVLSEILIGTLKGVAARSAHPPMPGTVRPADRR